MPLSRHRFILAACITSGVLSHAPSLMAQHTARVMVGHAATKTLPSTVVLVGSARPARVSLIGSEVDGLVQDLPVREGDYLAKGDLICKLKSDSLQLDLQAAREKLSSMQSAIAIAEAQLKRWTFEKKRIDRLSTEQKANDKEVSDIESGYLVAMNTVQEARRNFNEQQAIVQLNETELAKTAITAPFNGYVTVQHTEIGQWMQVGGSVVEIIDLDRILVRVGAPESAISYVRRDDPARSKFDALEKTFQGRIKHVIPQADERARTFPVDVEIDNPQHKLQSGMFARVTIRCGPEIECVAVPKDAVVQKDGINRVWIIQPAGPRGVQAVPVPVTLGAEVGEWVAVTSHNITAGTQVVIRGNERLMPFPSSVEIVTEDALVSKPGSAPADEADVDSPPALQTVAPAVAAPPDEG